MKDGDSVTEDLNAFNTVVSQLLSIDIKISNEDKCISLLCSLPDSWDSLVVAIGSNAAALQFDEIVLALLTEEMRQKNMAKAKTTSDEGGDVYLASSSSTHVDHEAWLIDSSAFFHFTSHREWYYEYEKYNGGDVFLGDDKKARTIGCRKLKLNFQGGRIRTLMGVLHIPSLARNLISVIKLDDAGIKELFDKDTCKMVWGALLLMWGVWIGTLYKLQGSTVVDGYNSSMVLESGAENPVVFGENTMIWHQRLGHIGEKVILILHGKGMVEGMTSSSLDFDFYENCVYQK
eukprot:PITA_26942